MEQMAVVVFTLFIGAILVGAYLLLPRRAGKGRATKQSGIGIGLIVVGSVFLGVALITAVAPSYNPLVQDVTFKGPSTNALEDSYASIDVTGHVVNAMNSTDKPANAEVLFFKAGSVDIEDAPTSDDEEASASTDSTGTYSLTIDKGQYDIFVKAPTGYYDSDAFQPVVIAVPQSKDNNDQSLSNLKLYDIGTIDDARSDTSVAVTNGVSKDIVLIVENNETDSILRDVAIRFTTLANVTIDSAKVGGDEVDIETYSGGSDDVIPLGDIGESDAVTVTITVSPTADTGSIAYTIDDLWNGNKFVTANVQDATAHTGTVTLT